MKILEFNVNCDGKELFLYLREMLPNMSKNNIKSLLVKGMILVNEKVITKYNYKLFLNDKIIIRREIENKNINDNINIIYEDNNFIVVNKPSGLLMIGTEKEREKTVYSIVSDYVKKNNKNNKIYIVHRLDKDTSGVVLLAKNQKDKKTFTR